MDKRLKLFILGKLRKMRKTQDKKYLFFNVLKRAPEGLKQIILASIALWTQEYADKRYRVVLLVNEEKAASEIIESLKRCLAREMAKIS